MLAFARLRRFAAAPLAAALFAAPAAHAEVTTAQCVEANTQAQSLRRAGKFAQAREELRACADPKCPAIVQSDCTTRLDELNKAQPTVVFLAKDASGADVGAVRVTVDGAPLTDKLDGTAVAVDPGQHTFTFTAAGRPAVTRTLILAEGDKDRREVVALDGAATPPAAAPAAATPSTAPAPAATSTGALGETPPPPARSSSTRTIGYVVGGVGIAAIGVGAYFGLTALSQKSDADSACGGSSSTCPTPAQTSAAQSKLQDARTSGWISTAAIGVGVASVAVGVYLAFFTGGSSTEAPAAALAVTPSGALFTGSF